MSNVTNTRILESVLSIFRAIRGSDGPPPYPWRTIKDVRDRIGATHNEATQGASVLKTIGAIERSGNEKSHKPHTYRALLQPTEAAIIAELKTRGYWMPDVVPIVTPIKRMSTPNHQASMRGRHETHTEVAEPEPGDEAPYQASHGGTEDLWDRQMAKEGRFRLIPAVAR